MHLPLLHLKWSGSLHFRSCAVQNGGSSSLVIQSGSPSHDHDFGMQRPELHLKNRKATKKHCQIIALIY